MAYVVTVRRRYGACTDPTHDHSYEDSRQTVATMWEAREAVVWAVGQFPSIAGSAHAEGARIQREDGGTVGPLPDGSTIHVAVAGA